MGDMCTFYLWKLSVLDLLDLIVGSNELSLKQVLGSKPRPSLITVYAFSP